MKLPRCGKLLTVARNAMFWCVNQIWDFLAKSQCFECWCKIWKLTLRNGFQAKCSVHRSFAIKRVHSYFIKNLTIWDMAVRIQNITNLWKSIKNNDITIRYSYTLCETITYRDEFKNAISKLNLTFYSHVQTFAFSFNNIIFEWFQLLKKFLKA